MSCRVITPWSDGPDHNTLAALTAEFDAEQIPKSRDSVGKKPKAKRRQARTKSSSEEVPLGSGENVGQAAFATERQISVSSDVSIKSEDDGETEAAAVETRNDPVMIVTSAVSVVILLLSLQLLLLLLWQLLFVRDLNSFSVGWHIS